jgi:hypothetical protein
MPDLLLIAGVNGAGKSTIFPSIQKSERVKGSFQPGHIEEGDFVNADDIERSTGSGQLGAARIAIERVYEKVRQGRNLALESTISGRGFRDGCHPGSEEQRLQDLHRICHPPFPRAFHGPRRATRPARKALHPAGQHSNAVPKERVEFLQPVQEGGRLLGDCREFRPKAKRTMLGRRRIRQLKIVSGWGRFLQAPCRYPFIQRDRCDAV